MEQKTGLQKAIETSVKFDKMCEDAAKNHKEFHEWYDKLSEKEKENYCNNLFEELAEMLNPIFEPLRKAGARIPIL